MKHDKLDYRSSAQEVMENMVPPHDWGGIIHYINYGIDPGGFLSAVICNDLKGAFGKADSINSENLKHIVTWFYNYAPSECWGSREKFESWVGIYSDELIQERNNG